MINPFTFAGRLGRFPYAAWSVLAFFSQHIVVALVLGRVPKIDLAYVVVPVRTLISFTLANPHPPALITIPAFVWFAAVAWALVALAFRRAADAGEFQGVAVLAITPVVQIPVILALSIDAPMTDDDTVADTRRAVTVPMGRAIAQGVAAGVGLSIAAVVLGPLVLGIYGYAVFLVSPLFIGGVTAHLANRGGDLGRGRTNALLLFTVMLCGISLLFTALEGVGCIIMASPLAIGAVLLGGAFGRQNALSSQQSSRRTLSAVAVLPLVFAGEAVVPPAVSFETVQTIEIAAPPSVVWNAIVDMSPLDEPAPWPSRFGVAYPIRAEIEGGGVGAIRRGYFSTGVAIERITEWIPGQKLAFVVERDPPAMNELSPYAKVYAPHVLGYFRTRSTSFELSATADGHTTIVERTAHELKLEPLFYFLPMAEWVVAENNARALGHIKRDAERAALESHRGT